ncbi:MAG: hypothetical protein Q8P77_01940 [Candidatus Veblenbacteria bacterium]|nr:hypothetical protein [Candidatus Veblenbacteria bacterium]
MMSQELKELTLAQKIALALMLLAIFFILGVVVYKGPEADTLGEKRPEQDFFSNPFTRAPARPTAQPTGLANQLPPNEPQLTNQEFTLHDQLTSQYLFKTLSSNDQSDSVIYAGFNRVIRSSGRSGTGLEKVGITFYPTQGESTFCLYNLFTNSNDCASAKYLSVVQPLAKNQAVVKIDFAVGSQPLNEVVFEAYYSASIDPSGFTLNIGDSISNDGWGGDAGDSVYDAELQISDSTLDIFGNDLTDKKVSRNLVHLSESVKKGSKVAIAVRNNFASWSIGE